MMPRFRDIRGGGGIRPPPMSYVEFERPCRLGLKSWVRFSRNEIDIQVLVILPITLNKTLSNLYE